MLFNINGLVPILMFTYFKCEFHFPWCSSHLRQKDNKIPIFKYSKAFFKRLHPKTFFNSFVLIIVEIFVTNQHFHYLTLTMPNWSIRWVPRLTLKIETCFSKQLELRIKYQERFRSVVTPLQISSYIDHITEYKSQSLAFPMLFMRLYT